MRADLSEPGGPISKEVNILTLVDAPYAVQNSLLFSDKC
jgi:hypothetical protein